MTLSDDQIMQFMKKMSQSPTENEKTAILQHLRQMAAKGTYHERFSDVPKSSTNGKGLDKLKPMRPVSKWLT